jgi:hypothetical protein
MSYFYEAAGVQVTWSGVDLSEGWGEDSFLTITPNSDRVEHSAGADGTYTFSKISDRGCTITMTFKDVAPVNKKIANIFAAQDVIGAALPVAPFTILDTTGDSVSFVALNAVLTAVPEITFQRTSGERTYTWICQSYLLAEQPSTITAAISDYVK